MAVPSIDTTQRLEDRGTQLNIESNKHGELQPAAACQLPVWTYWEGPCPGWIEACLRTIAGSAPRLIQLTPATFDQLWDRDRDIELSQLHVAHGADFIRAFLLWRYGGLWVDADCLVMKPLGPVLRLLREYDFVGHRERCGTINNAFIAARPQSRIATAMYERVCGILRSGRPLSWSAIGGDPLTAIVAEDPAGWYEFPCEHVQPICWSQPEKFFEERLPGEHEHVFDPEAICYLLSNQATKHYLIEHPQSDLMNARSFFSFLLDRIHGDNKGTAPAMQGTDTTFSSV